MLIPCNIEFLLNATQSSGNMGLNGVYLDLYYKRNLFYFSSLAILPCYFFKCAYIGVLAGTLSLCFFINSCYKWRDVIFKNNHFIV